MAYTQQYIPGNFRPEVIEDTNIPKPLPTRYGDPIYGLQGKDDIRTLIGRVGMAPVVTPHPTRDGAPPTITFADDPAYQKSQQQTAFEQKIASGAVESSGLYGPALDGGRERRAFAERESAYTSYDPATNIVKFYDPEGNVTQEGQRTSSGGGVIGGLMTGFNQTVANPDVQKAILGAAIGGIGALPGIGLNPFVASAAGSVLGNAAVPNRPEPAPAPIQESRSKAEPPPFDPNNPVGLGEPTLQVVVYGPDGTAYGTPAAARAAGVTNYTMSPPPPVAPPPVAPPPVAPPVEVIAPPYVPYNPPPAPPTYTPPEASVPIGGTAPPYTPPAADTSSPTSGTTMRFLNNPFNTNTASNLSAFQPRRNSAPVVQPYNNANAYGNVFNPTPTVLPMYSPAGTQINQNSGLTAPVPQNNQAFDTSYNNLLSGYYSNKPM